MKRKSSIWKEMPTMDEVRVLGYCAECGNTITDDVRECYCNDDGEYFCDIECLLTYYNISKIEANYE